MAKMKRYHQSKKDRRDESRGMKERFERSEKREARGDYMYEPSERKLERRDMGMLHEDRSAIANMPQDVKYHAWPKNDSYLYSQIDDGISGIDMEQKEAVKILNRHKSKSMY